MYRGKRIFDLIAALLLTFFAIPPVLFFGFLLFLLSGQNPVFKQQRPGLHEKIFFIYKLRTLYKDNQRSAMVLGQVIRALSIDELPQLYNVLKGEMSIVGPRPLLREYLKLYNEEQKQRHLTKPGITGWAQVNGRNALDWRKRFKFDVWYVNNQSMTLDIKILVFTIKKAFRFKEVKPEGLKDDEKFKGNI